MTTLEELVPEYTRTRIIHDENIAFEDPRSVLARNVKLSTLDIAKLATRHIRYGNELKPACLKVYNHIFSRTITWGHIHEAIPLTQFIEGGISQHGERFCSATGYSANTIKTALKDLVEQGAIVRWCPYRMAVTRYAINLLWTVAREQVGEYKEMWQPFDGEEFQHVFVSKRSILVGEVQRWEYTTLPVPRVFILHAQRQWLIPARSGKVLRLRRQGPPKLAPPLSGIKNGKSVGRLLQPAGRNLAGALNLRVPHRQK